VAMDFFGREVSPVALLESARIARKAIQPILQWQEELAGLAGHPKAPETPTSMLLDEIDESIRHLAEAGFQEILLDPHLSLVSRNTALLHLQAIVRAQLSSVFPYETEVAEGIIRFKNRVIRTLLKEGNRADGRSLQQARSEVFKPDFLSQVARGSGFYQQGDQQALSMVTLGPRDPFHEKPLVVTFDALPSSRNSVGRTSSSPRTQVELGLTIEGILRAVLPETERFGFLPRLSSELLTSDGGPLSATVNSASLALMSASVPISTPVLSSSQAVILDDGAHKIIMDPSSLELTVSDADVTVSGTKKGLCHTQVKARTRVVPFQVAFEAVDSGIKGFGASLEGLNTQLKDWHKSSSTPIQGKVDLPIGSRGKVIGLNGTVIRSLESTTGMWPSQFASRTLHNHVTSFFPFLALI